MIGMRYPGIPGTPEDDDRPDNNCPWCDDIGCEGNCDPERLESLREEKYDTRFHTMRDEGEI